MIKITKTEERFKKFVTNMKTAKTDKDIALISWDLVEDYHGFKYNWLARRSLVIIDNIFKKDEGLNKFLYNNTGGLDKK